MAFVFLFMMVPVNIHGFLQLPTEVAEIIEKCFAVNDQG